MNGRSLDDYVVLCTVGSGSYATCKKVKRKSDDKIFVWKEIYYGAMGESEKQMLVSEVNLLRELKHPNIVRYYDRIIDRTKAVIYIVMEYCPGGDLASYISKCRKEGTHTDEEFVWKILIQIVGALSECHRRKNGKPVLHRDLKPANVFLDANKDVKVGDFGLARVLQHETSFANTFVGTPYYMSPELVNNKSYNEKSDVWSLGCMLYELCALVPPFTAANQLELNQKICSGSFPKFPHRYSSDLQRIVARMLQVEVARRPTMKDILSDHAVSYHQSILDRGYTAVSPDDIDACRKNGANVRDKERKINDGLEKLKSREKLLEIKEREIKNREANVAVREKLAERKLERAESMLTCPRCHYNKENPRDGSRTPEIGPHLSPNVADEMFINLSKEPGLQKPRDDLDTPKKRVSFESESGKENDVVTNRANIRPTSRGVTTTNISDITNFTSDTTTHFESDMFKRELLRQRDLQKRLYDARLKVMKMRKSDIRLFTHANLLDFR